MEAMSMSRVRAENIVQRKGMKKEFIRTAAPSDFARIVEVGVSSLNGDPVATYFGCTTPASLKTYVEFILNLAHSVGGVIDVTTVSENEADEGEIISAAIWLPPKKRINTFNVYKLLTSGCIGLTSALGTQGVTRLGWEYPTKISESWMQPDLYLVSEGPSWSQADTWYLRLAFTANKYQKQGIMINMINQRLEAHPDSTFTLEATSPKSQHFFHACFGFQMMNRSTMGKGHVNESGEEQIRGHGVDVYSMLRKPVNRFNN